MSGAKAGSSKKARQVRIKKDNEMEPKSLFTPKHKIGDTNVGPLDMV